MSSEIIYSEVEQTDALPAPGISERTNGSERAALFPANETDNFRTNWRQIQADFVDEPRQAVEQANKLVERVTERLTDVFASERSKLENEWGQGKDVSTEDLRQALRRYRSFFDRLLSV